MIFDAGNNQGILVEYLEPWNPEFLYVRGEQINMRVLLKSLFRGGSREEAYIDCFIEKTRPRLVITFTDNHSGFHSIAARNRDIATLFLQNGIRDKKIFERLASRVSSGDSLKVNYMMSFGDYVGAEYAKYIAGYAISMGSVINNHVPKLKKKQSGIMVLVSQWEPYPGEWKNYFDCVHDLVLPWLVSYAKEKGKLLTILLRSGKQGDLLSQEKAYFRNLIGSEPEFYEPKDSYSGYHAIDFAEVVITFHSTLGFESIARGTKTAHFNIESEYLGCNEVDTHWIGGLLGEGLYWTNKPDPDICFRILDYLFEVDDVQWHKDLEDTKFSSLMDYDPGNIQLKSILEKELGLPPKTKDISISV